MASHLRLRRRPRALTAAALAAGLLLGSPSPSATAAPAVVLNQPKSLGGWGVVGLDLRTSPVPDFRSNVTALTEWNNRIYVGGMFTAVARNGVVQAAQPFLAAFDRATGAWVPSFRPALDGGVWDLAVTPSGKLLVAGHFSRAGGAATRGLALLDPTTGLAVGGFSTTVANGTSTLVGVRTMDVSGGWVYLGGNFTTVTGGTGAAVRTVRGKNLLRVRITDGRPDGTWKPLMSTAPWQVHASRAGDRVYAAGRFGTVNGTPKRLLAVLSAADGSLVPGLGEARPSIENPQDAPTAYAPSAFTVFETADRSKVVLGPTEHTIQSYTRASLARSVAHGAAGVPGNGGGGDFQAVAQGGGVVYASCHCWKWLYPNAWTTLNPAYGPWPGSSPTARLSGMVALDATTFQPITTFRPAAYGTGNSAWQLFVDSRGCLWAGGDYTHAPGGMWLGGFAKFCAT